MTAATKDVKTDSYGGEDGPLPTLYAFPVAAATTIYGGTLVATDASGNASAGVAGALRVWGRCEEKVDNSTGAAGDKYVTVKPGVFYLNNDTVSAVSNANRGQYVYVKDDNTVSASNGGGSRAVAGFVVDVPASGAPNYGKVAVAVGMARPEDVDTSQLSGSTAFQARAVATSIGAYTAASGVVSVTATGALGSQDGVAVAAGDVILIPEGISNVTAADAGPYTITTIGNTAAGTTLTRPDWWGHGDSLIPGRVIQVGGEGTLFKGSAWKTFAAKAKTIGTDAPALYPDYVCQSVTLASGLITVTNVPILSATKTFFGVNRTTVGGTVTTTVQYNPSAITAGILNAGSFQIAAQTSTGATDTADTSTLNIAVENW